MISAPCGTFACLNKCISTGRDAWLSEEESLSATAVINGGELATRKFSLRVSVGGNSLSVQMARGQCPAAEFAGWSTEGPIAVVV